MSETIVERNPDDAQAIWLRRPRETAAAYTAFVLYREQVPPRSLAKLGKAIGKSKNYLAELSSKWDWVARSDAYTDHLDRLQLAAHEEDIARRRREENEEVFELARQLRFLAAARIVGMTDDDGKLIVRPLDPDTLDPDEVVRIFEASNKATRLAIGLPTDVTGSIQVSLNDLQRVLSGFLDLAAKRMTPEQHEALVRDCSAMVREQLGG